MIPNNSKWIPILEVENPMNVSNFWIKLGFKKNIGKFLTNKYQKWVHILYLKILNMSSMTKRVDDSETHILITNHENQGKKHQMTSNCNM
jgi:hypothetical protein